MLHIFFDPKRLYTLNEYDSPEYSFIGKVLSFDYKVFKKDMVFEGEWVWRNFLVPDEQYNVKLNDLGQLHFIRTIKGRNLHREYIGIKYWAKPGVEQPITYYEKFYSGGTLFLYDQENRLTEYITDINCMGKPVHHFKRQFEYDSQGNLYPLFQGRSYLFEDDKLVMAVEGSESDKWFSKEIIEYDEVGRIVKIMEYGYDEGEDENGEHIYYTEKGIQHLNTRIYTYESISQNETKCTREANFWTSGQNLKQIIVYDEKGFKRSHQHYSFDGSLYETSNYHFIFDNNGNWTKAVVDVKMGSEKDVRDSYFIFERDIQYDWEQKANISPSHPESLTWLEKLHSIFKKS
ncbi:hypothetical protein SAMN05192574_104277 [Mucilaginibacter gossypiicola]|uniref:Uncharacterized protein n=1 Tax=Mucilaginibacter gossypiicola TaxID=551995 RepID=A0A1H8JQZ1_9SPHI|nr:hypothetical protein [Mucilaginibacter gossypiicola]SEN82736.1 hypothetical protein SAMN05192574_104277 [Mucilaginibacter gossypiicola]